MTTESASIHAACWSSLYRLVRRAMNNATLASFGVISPRQHTASPRETDGGIRCCRCSSARIRARHAKIVGRRHHWREMNTTGEQLRAHRHHANAGRSSSLFGCGMPSAGEYYPFWHTLGVIIADGIRIRHRRFRHCRMKKHATLANNLASSSRHAECYIFSVLPSHAVTISYVTSSHYHTSGYC